MRRSLKFALLLPLPFLAAVALLVTSWLHTYQRLTDEKLIAELTFEPVGERSYLVGVTGGDLCHAGTYLLRGDQWRLDAEFIKWKYWATLFGLDAMYRLDRLEGRYRDAAEQSSRPISAHALPRRTSVDLVAVAEALGPLNFLLDASYGSSVYREMNPHLVYRVYRTQTGLITRAEPYTVPPATQTLVIDIDHDCGGEDGWWLRAAGWLEDKVMQRNASKTQ